MTNVRTVHVAVPAQREGADRAILTVAVIGAVVTAALVCVLLYGAVAPRSTAEESAASADQAIAFFGP